jgi:hypothetical protein
MIMYNILCTVSFIHFMPMDHLLVETSSEKSSYNLCLAHIPIILYDILETYVLGVLDLDGLIIQIIQYNVHKLYKSE